MGDYVADNSSGVVTTASIIQSLSTVSAQLTVPTVTQVPLNGVTNSSLSAWVGLDRGALSDDFLNTPILFSNAVATYSDGTAADLSLALPLNEHAAGGADIAGDNVVFYSTILPATDSILFTEAGYWSTTTPSDPLFTNEYYY